MLTECTHKFIATHCTQLFIIYFIVQNCLPSALLSTSYHMSHYILMLSHNCLSCFTVHNCLPSDTLYRTVYYLYHCAQVLIICLYHTQLYTICLTAHNCLSSALLYTTFYHLSHCTQIAFNLLYCTPFTTFIHILPNCMLMFICHAILLMLMPYALPHNNTNMLPHVQH